MNNHIIKFTVKYPLAFLYQNSIGILMYISQALMYLYMYKHRSTGNLIEIALNI